MSAVTERERRATAGRRMSSLVGKAAEDDDAFWSHDVWADENDSGNESFRESDEDSEQRVDRFDSDFDDSESDHEADEVAAGAAEEAELQRLERSSSRKKHMDISNAGRDLLKKKKGTSRKRKKDLMGDGFNAGLVLNLPPSAGAAVPPQPIATGVAAIPQQAYVKETKAKTTSPAKQVGTLASTRSLRSTQAAARRTLRARTKAQEIKKSEATRQSSQQTSQQAKKRQKRFTQEELLLEAATVTEPENERWLLGRKRSQDLENALSAKTTAGQRDARGGKVVSKFHSRRGRFNTLTFPEMDAVPAILARKQTKTAAPRLSKKKICVITGKPARYRDPKSNMHYFDIAAFKELRRRIEAGEPIDQRKVESKKDKAVSTTSQPATGTDGKKKVVDSRPCKNGSVVTTPISTAQTTIGNATPVLVDTNDLQNGSEKGSAKKSMDSTLEETKSSSKLTVHTVKSPSDDAASVPSAAQLSKKPGVPLQKPKGKHNTVMNKSRKAVSPTTSSLIHNALAAYTQLKHEKED